MNLRNASFVCGVIAATFVVGCDAPSPEPEITLVLTGQTLVKKDPRLRWDDPFGTLRSIVEGADVSFTNFEMAVVSDGDRCGLPLDYEVSLGTPSLPPESRPGNTGGPHAVQPAVMDFLADLGFDLMSLSNNHAWDLGDCGVAATGAAAEANGIVHAGTGRDVEAATTPGFITVGDMTIGLIAATTSHDERSAIHDAVNGIWTGWQEDWDRNVKAVQDAAARADFVIFYQHFQIDSDEFSGLSPGDSTGDGHMWVDDVGAWQTAFARAVLDAGASLYVGHGHRAFDGIEVYKGKPLLRQLGGLAYQGLNPVIGAYDEHRPWEGLIAKLTIRGGMTQRIDFTPLDLDEGEAYRRDHGDVEFLSRRGLPQVATGPLADSILRRFRELSARYGVAITVADGHAALSIAPER
jgi:poly-gamma-glutamate synthesis protein (capsule biosynthesis protein)